MTQATTATHPAEYSHTDHVHVVPLWLLASVWIILLVLTGLTVAVTYYDLGKLNIWVALLVAVVKGSFVGLYFMHLRYESSFNSLVFVCALLFVMLFIGLAMLDTAEYQPDFAVPRNVAMTP